MTKKNISVIIPTFNRADKLIVAVDSVLNQTHNELELIIVDDGSTDDTRDKIGKINDNRLHYYCLSKNSGASAARNFGVEKSQFDIIAFHDSDDIWHPQKLEKQLDYWFEHPDDIMIYCAITYNDPDSGEPVTFPFADISRASLSGDMHEFLLHRNTIDTPTMLIKKDFFVKAGGFDPLYPPLEDWEFNLRISRLGTIGYVDESLVTSGISEGSLSSSTSAYYKARCEIFANYINDIQSLGIFDEIAIDILRHAEKDGVLDSVKKMMMLVLASHYQ